MQHTGAQTFQHSLLTLNPPHLGLFLSVKVVNDASADPMTAVGVTGCGALHFGGFCGGGGYVISKRAIDTMSHDPDFMAKYDQNCKLTQYCDITTGWILMQYGFKLISDPKIRLHSWGFVTGRNYPDAANHDKEYAELTVKLIDHLKKHKVASLHYRGGQISDDFETKHSKMMFLHRIFTMVYLNVGV